MRFGRYLHDLGKGEHEPRDAKQILQTIVSKMPAKLRPSCGTDSGYKLHLHYGERTCDPCVEAHNLVSRRNRGEARRRGEPKRHGTIYAYKTYRCRCDECSRAEAECHRAYRARKARRDA